MHIAILDRGRGPEIAGTRITVYDVLDYHLAGHHHTFIAALFNLSSSQVMAALQYIETHQEEVMTEYRQMLARDARGNPPEIQEKLKHSHAKLMSLLTEEQQALARELTGEGNSRGH